MTTFLIDLDSVCNDLWGYIFKEYKKETGVEYNKSVLRSWKFEDIFPDDFLSWLYSTINSKDFWSSLPPKPDCIEVLSRLSREHKVFIVSAHYNGRFSNKYYYSGKLKWIEKNLPFLDVRKQVIFTSNKNSVCGDAIFDDSPKNINNFDRITVAMDYPYNRHSNPTFRVNSWKQAEVVFSVISLLLSSGFSIIDIHKCSSIGDMVRSIDYKLCSLRDADRLLRDFLLESMPLMVIGENGKVKYKRNNTSTNIQK